VFVDVGVSVLVGSGVSVLVDVNVGVMVAVKMVVSLGKIVAVGVWPDRREVMLTATYPRQ